MLRDAEPFPFPRLRDHRLFLPNPTFVNPAWEEASPRVLILRLSTFADVARSTPHLFLAGEARRGCPYAFIDMAFLPGPNDARLLEEAGLPLILGTQSHRTLESFDMVLVSNSHLLELVNLPFLLSHSAVPLWAGQRDGRWPPLILGGSNATAAHSLVSRDGDCMADAIFFGEGEGAVARIVKELAPLAGPRRKARLAEMEMEGLWAPSGTGEARRARCEVGMTSAEPGPVLPGPEATTARLSITLGCPCLCSFCYEGHDRRPFREIPADTLVEQARRLKRETGAVTLELASFNFNTHSELARLLIRLHRLFLRVNVMSQRVDILARTPGLLDLELAADKRSFTLGIEGISGRQRRFLHKSLSDSDVERALEALNSHRIREVKLFYILTGNEVEEDFAELSAFVKWLKDMRKRADAPPRTVFSFGMLVRMPFTPLRYDPPVFSGQTWRQLAGRAKSICETNGFEFRLAHALPEYHATQALALSHPSLSDLLIRLSERGCISPDGLPPGGEAVVEAWFQEHVEQVLGEKPRAHRFAFSFLETETSRDALYRQYQGARAGKDAGYAAGRGSTGRSTGRSAVPAESVQELAGITQAKHKLSPIHREAVIPAEAAWLGGEWKDGWLMRRFLALCPGQLENVLSISESMVGSSGILGPDTPWFGRSVVAVTAWDPGSFAHAAQEIPELFGRPVQGFRPGSWSSLHVSLTLPRLPDPADALAKFLKDSYAPVTIRRKGGSFSLVVPDKSARKKLVLAGKGGSTEAGVRMELDIGTKLRLGDFLDSLGNGLAASVLVEVSGIG
jgi:Radical SAM superfamily/Radical SAM proteins, N-terminal